MTEQRRCGGEPERPGDCPICRDEPDGTHPCRGCGDCQPHPIPDTPVEQDDALITPPLPTTTHKYVPEAALTAEREASKEWRAKYEAENQNWHRLYTDLEAEREAREKAERERDGARERRDSAQAQWTAQMNEAGDARGEANEHKRRVIEANARIQDLEGQVERLREALVECGGKPWSAALDHSDTGEKNG